MSASARAMVERHERSVSTERRRSEGVHYTPPEVARAVLDEAFLVFGGRLPGSICDPTCGAGSFLLVAAEALRLAGVPVHEILERRICGAELDPAAAQVARDALATWAADHGAPDAAPLRVQTGDALMRPPQDWRDRPPGGFDLVLGNPPFLGQLDRRTRRDAALRDELASRFGRSFGYADTAALFLLAAVDLVGHHGVVAMVQPQSLLAGRGAAAVREALIERADLMALWASDERHFEAQVRVCAPVLRRSGGVDNPERADGPDPPAPPVTTVRVAWVGGAGGTSTVTRSLVPAGSWAPLLAEAHGIPTVARCSAAPTPGSAATRRVLGEVATATAGFRDEYYALRDAVVEDAERSGQDAAGERSTSVHPRLVTVGMVEPGWSEWGRRAHRIGGRMRTTPRVDAAALAAASPRVARWSAARQVPKVLVATQTRVVEAVPDPLGDVLPMTPLISVEPHADSDLDVWMLTAALLAPPVAASALARHLGLGLSASTLRWSAAAVLDVELPLHRGPWEDAAAQCGALLVAEPSERAGLLDRIGVAMCAAHGLAVDHPVLDWWRARVRRP